MKKIVLILVVLLTISCKAQYSLQEYDNDLPSGSYCADTFNDFNNYEGTWKALQGNKEFTIILNKKTHVYYPFEDIYTDFLTGEYLYKNGSQILIDTRINLRGVL